MKGYFGWQKDYFDPEEPLLVDANCPECGMAYKVPFELADKEFSCGACDYEPEQDRPDSDYCSNCGHDLGDISDYGCWVCDPASFVALP